MKLVALTMMVCVVALLFTGAVTADPQYIYGIHDLGGQVDFVTAGVTGWILVTRGIGCDPNDYTGEDYSAYTNAGHGVICRLNNGYNPSGCLPYQSLYQNFAQRCANYVANSPGCHIWIIGNETNYWIEWPGNTSGDTSTGEPITIARYHDCYDRCYTAIKALPGHSTDTVMPAAVGTWGPPIPGKSIEAFDDYFVNMLTTLGSAYVDGIALHSYTHGYDPALVFSEALMGAPYEDIHYNFRVYKDYMSRIPAGFTTKPVYITECDQVVAWSDTNSGWVKNIYSEINSWNNTSGNQKIRTVCLFRWLHAGEGDAYYICDRGSVRQDWRDAMAYDYVWTTDTSQNDANTGTDAGNTFATATSISPGSYTGYVDSSDTNDYYKFSVNTGQTITASMVPPAGADFDLYLYNPSGTQKAVSTNGTGLADLVNFTADATGYWAIRVYRYSSSGTYNFSVTLNSMNNNTPTGTNYATSATAYSTDTYYSSGYTGAYAKDASTSTKWCSTNATQTHWLAFDLGGEKTIKGFIVKLASAGGEGAGYNAKNFKLQTGTSISGPWTDECVVDNANQAGTIARSYTTPKAMQYVRLYITNPGSDYYARIPEFEVWGTSSGMSSGTPTGVNKAPSSTDAQVDTYYSADYNGWKAIDSSTSTKWCTTNATQTHWLALDLGTDRTVNGYIVKHAAAGGETTSYNTNDFKIQSASSMSGPWTDECSVTGNTANTTGRVYSTAKQLRYVRLYITDPGSDYFARIPEFEVWCVGNGTQSQNFESMPSWTSSYDATWGSAATWSIVAGGQSGNCLQVSRSSQGSSCKVLVYSSLATNTNYTISIYMKCPSYSGTYWVETAYKLGTNTATNYDQDSSTWTMVKKFSNTGTNGNGNVWTEYTVAFNSGSNTSISIGYKHGASGCVGPTACWDTFLMQ